jgi:hypothetical protein
MSAAVGSDFEVQYKAESIGTGFEGTIGTVNVATVPAQLTYNGAATRFNIAANTGPTAGTFKLVATVRCLHAGFIAGYVEGPIIQVI